MADTTLNDLFEDSVQVSVNDITWDLHPGEVDPPNEPCKIIFGKLYCHARLGKKAIQGSLKNAWASITGWSWKEREDGLLQFSFRTSFDAENVLLRRPWLVCGHLLVLMPWPSWLTPEEVKFDKTPIWVRLKSIPPFYWNKTNLQELPGKVSSVYELPRHIEKNFERGSFEMGTLRFRATVELSKPLFSGFFLRRPGIKDVWLQYQYEKLPRICFKCGLMTHEQKFCFKTPPVIKDDKGGFFPMFGNWMAEDASEKSPFHIPLPKWFIDWIVNQKAAKEEKMRTLLRNQRINLQIEAADMRELHTQYPGKRSQVETVVEIQEDASEEVLNRYPAVHLTGICEVTAFENTANLIVEKILPDLPLVELIKTSQLRRDVPSCSGTKPMFGKVGDKLSACTFHLKENDNEPLENGNGNKPNMVMSTEVIVGSQVEIAGNDTSNGINKGAAQKKTDETSPNKVEKQFDLGPGYENILRSQAHHMEWPSKECWELAFEQLLGAKTVDKYHREPTLYNPILDIEEIRCYEAEQGPRKRKATNGFYMLPKKTNHDEFSTGKQNEAPRYEEEMASPSPDMDPSPLATKSRSLKREGGNRRLKKVSKHYCDPWNTASVELAIDLDNHFVVIEKNSNVPSKCVIEEIEEAECQQQNLNSNITRAYIPPVGRAGGFGLYWRCGLKCKVSSEDKNLINVLIESDPPGNPWNLLGVYGPPNLNGTLAYHESLHYANQGNSARYSFDLRRMVARTGIVDLGSQGGKYTWFQKSTSVGGGCSLKRARRDRALASIDWRMIHPSAITNVLSAATSDHRPILLDTEGGANYGKSMFKYELMW
ncbi:hypothetical protein G4B88_018203 [Cannabis sativa]|uniref:DUF4283 domain-containing protein n=1 Tax=Cannabis sativa TaxID=3483 RepID=A0A7J6G9F6_CANSA|nr:hypothetical protein G4B88_018203 [Cannabis sativa]